MSIVSRLRSTKAKSNKASSSVISSDTMSTPSSSKVASTGTSASSHMREGPHSSPHWTVHSTFSQSSAMDGASYGHPTHLESALTCSPNSRTTGLPSTVSSTTSSSYPTPKVAISAPINTNIYTTRQDVPPTINQSSTSAPRFNAQPSLDLSASSSNNVLNNHSARPRTSNQVFVSSSDLAAHYGIPLSLPPLPTVQSRTSETVTQPLSHSTAVPDFSALKANYLNMLSQKSTEPTSSVDMSNPTVSPADLQRPVASDFGEFEGIFDFGDYSSRRESSAPTDSPAPASNNNAQGSDSLTSPFEPNDYLTSPWTPSLDNIGDSPDETPFADFLSTPLIDDSNMMYTGPHELDMCLFPEYIEKASESSAKAPLLDPSGLLTISPSSPGLATPALNPASLFSPSQPMSNENFGHPQQSSTASDEASSTNGARRRTSATGTRKNVTPDSLVPLEAPTQARRYLTPSATSRKELPAVFARKRARQVIEAEEDELAEEPLKPNATELEQIEWKRRQNTLAARKSRKRKLQHQQDLETRVAELNREKEVWRQRALMLQLTLQSHGVPFNEFQD